MLAMSERTLTMRYTNWRGEVGERRIAPHRLIFGSKQWHTSPQLPFMAWDHDRKAIRECASAGCEFHA